MPANPTSWRKVYRSFGWYYLERGPWRVERKPGNALWDVFKRNAHVAYMTSEDAALAYCSTKGDL